MNRPWNMLTAAASLGLLLAIAPLSFRLYAQDAAGVIEFTPDRWDLRNAKVVDHLGRKALIGTALLKDVEFEDGIIECDIAVKAGVRAYPGVLLRIQTPGDYERIYVRPHRPPFMTTRSSIWPPSMAQTAGNSTTVPETPLPPSFLRIAGFI